MDKTERNGLGVAVVGHVALFGLLSVGFLEPPKPAILVNPPVEVVLTNEVGLTSAAPDPSREEPAAKLAEVEGPVEPDQPPPAPELPPEPKPDVRPPTPAPKPAKKPVEKPADKPAEKPVEKKPKEKPAKPAPAPAAPKASPKQPDRKMRPTGRLDGITDGLTDKPSKSTSTRPKTNQTATQARKSIDVAIDGAIRPHWRPPSGVDAEQLVTTLEIRLNKDGSLAGDPKLVDQSGRTQSNTPQQKLHVERAIKAIRLAAPFSNLPPEFYDQWKIWRLTFDARLAR